ncbi:hypothetical protein Hanom_Chr01g00063081 [Helianthus anomalus]
MLLCTVAMESTADLASQLIPTLTRCSSVGSLIKTKSASRSCVFAPFSVGCTSTTNCSGLLPLAVTSDSSPEVTKSPDFPMRRTKYPSRSSTFLELRTCEIAFIFILRYVNGNSYRIH